jgi:hypothetical protein
MSDFTPTPPPVPPMLNTSAAIAASPGGGSRPLGEDPQDREPIPSPLAAIESILRHPRRILFRLREPGSGNLIFALLLIAYWAVPVKIACGLIFSALICLPSLYIFSCLSGSQARLVEVVGLIAGLLALMTVLLIGFAPVAWVFSQSTDSLPAMGALHLTFWIIATYFGLRFLCAGFAQLSGRSGGLGVWITIFMLVMVQMTTALRPIVGTADTLLPSEKKFFVKHWIEQLEKPAGTGALPVQR